MKYIIGIAIGVTATLLYTGDLTVADIQGAAVASYSAVAPVVVDLVDSVSEIEKLPPIN